jgi:choline kinase
MRAVLMAAGMGKRLASASGGIAKALVEVNGTALLVHQINTLRAAGFDDGQVVIVGGFEFERLAPLAMAAAPNATLLENTQFHHQNLLSLLTAREQLSEGFLLVNVDHLMPPLIHQRMLNVPAPVVACVESGRELAGDEMKVKLNEQGQLSAIAKTLTDFDLGYIGMTRVRAGAVGAYLDAADAVLERIGPEKAVVEMVLGKLAESAFPVAVCDCPGIAWAEVDTPEDLAGAEALLRTNPGFFEAL